MSSNAKALAKKAPQAVTQQQPDPRQLVVIAKSADELLVGNQQLIGWAQDRINTLQAELDDTEANLAHATKRKWKVEPWKRRVRLVRKRIDFYIKVKAALEEGYCMVPDFPVDVFVIRTSRKNPKRNRASSTWSNVPVDDQQTNTPPLGEGRNVCPQAITETWSEEEVNEKTGKTETRHFAAAAEFDEELEFPVTLVKPQILEDVSRAETLKVFDEIGILPEARRRGADPVVVGRVVLRESSYQERAMTFLISWWVDRQDF